MREQEATNYFRNKALPANSLERDKGRGVVLPAYKR